MKTTHTVKLPTKDQILERTGGTPEDWAGRCHEISGIVAELIGPDLTVVRRGYYLGEVTPHSYFGEHGDLGQHSWVELTEYDEIVVDPTRFAFKGGPAWPLWLGSDAEYDIGGCKLAAPAGPPPESWDTTNYKDEEMDPPYIDFRIGCPDYVGDLLGTPPDLRFDDGLEITMRQARWLANLPIGSRVRWCAGPLVRGRGLRGRNRRRS